MPELPEVETVRRGLERFVVGRTIAAVTVAHPRSVRRHAAGADDLCARLAGRAVLAARRRGKFLWLPLEPAGSLVAHLGMSGQLLMRPVSAADETHLRVRVMFADDIGTELRFVDQRTFGGLSLDEGAEPVPAPVRHIAADPLDEAFDAASVAARLRRRRCGVKRALLDQTLLSGVGNIYADEALWRAKLHFDRRADSLRSKPALDLLESASRVLQEALAQGGTSFDSLYVNVNGESGYFARSLDAYGREGQPCRRCGTPIRREPFMNRSSYRCPRCQPAPRLVPSRRVTQRTPRDPQ